VAKICKKNEGNRDIYMLTVGNSEHKGSEQRWGSTINSCHNTDEVARTWPRRGGKRIGTDLPAHTLISLIVPYLIYFQKTLLQYPLSSRRVRGLGEITA